MYFYQFGTFGTAGVQSTIVYKDTNSYAEEYSQQEELGMTSRTQPGVQE
jgi:hypothetical protein